MIKTIPFSGLRYSTDIVGDLSAVTMPLCDIISEKMQKKFYKAHPFNVVRLECGEEFADDSSQDNKYTRCTNTLEEWIESGVLIRDEEPSVYVCTQSFTAKDGTQHCSKGIMCLIRLDENIISCEETFLKEKNDKYNLLSTAGANFAPVYALCNDKTGEFEKMLNSVSDSAPENSFATPDGVCHNIRKITDEDFIEKFQNFIGDKTLFIAEGHHSYEAALRFKEAACENNPAHTGEEAYNYILMFVSDMNFSDKMILPMHRVVKNIADFSEEYILSLMEENFNAEKIPMTDSGEIKDKISKDSRCLAMYTGKDYFYVLTLKNTDYKKADAAALQTLILNKIFGMAIENSENILYTESYNEAKDAAVSDEYQCAFFLNPLNADDFLEIIQDPAKIPARSAGFYPLPAVGTVMNKFY